MIFVAKNNYVFLPNFCMWSFYARYTSGELIKILYLSEVFILDICLFSFVI
jgi:hypothetical protein